MRLPNGFGSVYKLQGNRRRPWVVKKTIDGHQKTLSYFETHDAALTFLLKYNHEPTGFTATFADIYEQWKPPNRWLPAREMAGFIGVVPVGLRKFVPAPVPASR